MMNFRTRPRYLRVLAPLMAATISLSALAACGQPAAQQPTQQSEQDQAANAEGQTTVPPDQVVFRGAELTNQVEETMRLPYLGMEIVTSDALRALSEKNSVIQIAAEQNDAAGKLSYAILGWCALTDAQQEEEVPGAQAQQWVENLTRSGALGLYAADQVDQLDVLTGCDQHKKLGEIADGAYHYYLSTNSEGDPALVQAVQALNVTLSEPQPLTEDQSYFSNPPAEMTGSVGEFSTTDINGNAVDQSIFSEHDLTLVNLFTTWCSPCVQEIPELEKLYQEMQAKGVGVAGFVLDTRNGASVDQQALEKAKVLAERTGATFPMLIPDEGLLGGKLEGIDAVPQTIFVDRSGNIVGETYLGARSLEDWKAVVEKELAAYKEAG